MSIFNSSFSLFHWNGSSSIIAPFDSRKTVNVLRELTIELNYDEVVCNLVVYVTVV